MEMISLKCPECGANINIEADHKHCFCPYCGVQIIIDDGVTAYTYRKVDEAKIKEAEVDKIIRLKELELKEKQITKEEHIRDLKIKCTIVLGSLAIIAAIFGWFFDIWLFIACILIWTIGGKSKNNKKENSK